MKVYIRDRNPICYEAKVFFTPELRVELSAELLSSDLSWCWESIRRDPNEVNPNSNLPPGRSMTVLSKDTVVVFLADLKERDADGYGRWIALFGVDSNAIEALLDGPGGPSLRFALEQFESQEAGPIRIIVVQVSDMNYEYVFVPHKPITAVTNVLRAWGIDSNTSCENHPYKELRLAQLESIYELRPGVI